MFGSFTREYTLYIHLFNLYSGQASSYCRSPVLRRQMVMSLQSHENRVGNLEIE